MASLNKVMLIGNLGRDPDVRYMPNGDAVCNFSIATTDTWKDKNGQRQERTEWHNIVMYRRLAEVAGEYLSKGRSVYIEGRIQTRKWEKDGQERYTTEIIADQMQMLGGRDADSGVGQERQRPAARPAPAPATEGGSSFDEFIDDIPF